MLTLILSQKLMIKASEIAVLNFVIGILGMPIGLLGGKLADTYSKKVIIVCDLVSIFTCVYPAFTKLFMVSILVFAFGALFLKHQQAYFLNYLGMNLGMVLSPTIAGLLFQNYLWFMFLLQGICIGFSTILITLFLDESQVYQTDNVYEEAKDNISLKEIIKENSLIFAFVFINVIYFAIYCEYQYLLPLDMGSVHGDNRALIYGTVSSINCIVVVLFTPLFTKVFSKLRDIEKTEVGSLLVALGFVIYLLCRGFVPVCYFVMIVFTWGEIFATIGMDTYVTTRTPSSHVGRMIALGNAIQSFMIGGFEMIIGTVYDKAGSAIAWSIVIGTGCFVTVENNLIRRKDRVYYRNLYR